MARQILMPSLSAGMTEGKLVRWLKKEGEAVRKGEPVAEVETDKAVLELEALDAGRLHVLVREGGDAVPVDQPIAVLLEEGEEAAEPAVGGSVDPRRESAAGTARAQVVSSPDVTGGRPRHHASPRVRRLARESGVELGDLAGSGPGGRVVARDIEGVPGSARSHETVIPHSAARKVAAKRLVEAKATIPHFYLSVDCEVDALLGLHARLNDSRGEAQRLSLNDFIVRACALALRRVPRMNSTWSEEAVRVLGDVDIAVAVAGEDGLMTPVVRQADRKPVAEIASEMRELAAKARARRLRPEEYQGGSFTLSNLGMFGVREFAPIINPPQAAILAVGSAEKRPVVRGDALGVGTVMTLTLSCDHRVIDGAEAAQFLSVLKELIEDPTAIVASTETGQ